MGVLRCDRRECANIMCDRFSYTHGYICDECFEELKSLWISGDYMDVEDFLDSESGDNTFEDKTGATQRLEEIFPIHPSVDHEP